MEELAIGFGPAPEHGLDMRRQIGGPRHPCGLVYVRLEADDQAVLQLEVSHCLVEPIEEAHETHELADVTRRLTVGNANIDGVERDVLGQEPVPLVAPTQQ